MRARSFLSILTLVLLSARADAAVVLALSVDELLERSEVVCLFRVDDTRARRFRGGIVTDVRGTCERAILGAADGDSVLWVALGGVVDGIGARVPGEPVFRPGDRALVFLSPAAGSLRVTGMAQGAAFVRGSRGAAAEQIGPAGVGATLVGPAGRGIRASWLPEPRPLAEVLDDLEAHVDATR